MKSEIYGPLIVTLRGLMSRLKVWMEYYWWASPLVAIKQYLLHLRQPRFKPLYSGIARFR